MPNWSPSAAARPPILLLDEVAAHLDPARRAALFDRLEGRGQVWMTATEPALFDAIGGVGDPLSCRGRNDFAPPDWTFLTFSLYCTATRDALQAA